MDSDPLAEKVQLPRSKFPRDSSTGRNASVSLVQPRMDKGGEAPPDEAEQTYSGHPVGFTLSAALPGQTPRFVNHPTGQQVNRPAAYQPLTSRSSQQRTARLARDPDNQRQLNYNEKIVYE